jgi:hypothetical protein
METKDPTYPGRLKRRLVHQAQVKLVEAMGERSELDALKLQVATRAAMEDLSSFGAEVMRPRVFPIAIYFDTEDDTLVEGIVDEWKKILAELDCEVIAERTLQGSRLRILFAKTKKAVNAARLKEIVTEVQKRVVKISKAGLNTVRGVILCNLMFAHSAGGLPVQKPEPHVMPESVATQVWNGVTSEDSLGRMAILFEGYIGIFQMLGAMFKKREGGEDKE